MTSRLIQNASIVCAIVALSATACKTPTYLSTDKNRFEVIAYYNGDGSDLHRYKWEQLTQVIYSFCHLKGDRLVVDNAADSLVIIRLTALKRKYPYLKVLLSLGGWGGCAPCSAVFSSAKGRENFALSVQQLLQEYQADGIDLDWEYPAIEGYPGHTFAAQDRHNFTLLVQELRRVLGTKKEISFAAGGFNTYFDQSVEWGRVMPLVDRVNLMSYDLVSGFSTVTGHHTPLYSCPGQTASVDAGVQYLKKMGVPAQKIAIGAAFYARTWVGVRPDDHGLFKPGTFKSFISFKQFDEVFTPANGFVIYRDTIAAAPYAYSKDRGEFATFDDRQSIADKTRYAKQNGLGGIMFWQLGGDQPEGGLLQIIHLAARR